MRNKRSAQGPPAPAEEGMAGAAGPAGRLPAFEEPPLLMAAPRVGQPGRFKWMFAAVWLFYLVDPVAKVATSNHTVGFQVLIYSLVTVFVIMYGWLAFQVYPKSGRVGVVNEAPRGVAPILVVMGVIAFVTSLWVDSDLAGMWVYVGAGAGLGLSMTRGVAYRGVLYSLAMMTVCCLISSDLRSLGTWLTLLFPTFFAGMSTLGIRQMALLIGQLREARTQVAHLATNEERLRLARDLHDLTGHSLSMITLKSELAQRMLIKARDAAPDGPTPRLDAALKEVEEIEQVSRQTLTDIRQAVSGYRLATLAVEVASAHAALDAAGIKLAAAPEVAAATGEFDPLSESALAWSLREAVTNAIRHSGADHVEVTLEHQGDEMVLTVRNDGRGLAATAGETDACGGHGLTGLRERLDAVGGRLSVGGGDGDFRLVAAAPERGSAARGLG
ncbi:sensor histidine kinase [Catenulispora pinisilvae]|uniref:sensor histidine kinase n=1 Tax=Catenulispora pinisilvae TaxID=2705253 RepID=UPI001890EF63|nr:sensor histidine kinase [Catenulispora pinisilvae]